MKTNQAGIDLIKRFEGCKLEAYRCPAGVLTIGYGTTRGVYEGMKITESIAEKMLTDDLEAIETRLSSFNLKVNENQFSALVSFIYNLGFGNFLNSTLFGKIKNNPKDISIKLEFERWVKAGGKILPGLVKRRAAEWGLFNST